MCSQSVQSRNIIFYLFICFISQGIEIFILYRIIWMIGRVMLQIFRKRSKIVPSF